MGHPILHDPEAVVGHRFRESFDNYDVPFEQFVVNQLRMARKNFTEGVWSDWVDRCRQRHLGRLTDHPEGMWARIWELFEEDRVSVEQERSQLHAHRVRDEFWYAERFGLTWPRLSTALSAPIEDNFESFQTQASPSPGPSPSPPPPPCGATLRFLDSQNNEIAPATKALNVSNWIANDGLPQNSAFNDTSSDPDNFRLEVEDAGFNGGSVSVSLQVGELSPTTYVLNNKSGHTFRGEFLRLVTDVSDASAGGDMGRQRVFLPVPYLGQTVTLRYRRPESDCEDEHQIRIGRPASENDNGPDQLRHGIRELKVKPLVFSTRGVTYIGGAINAAQESIKLASVTNVHQGPAVVTIDNEVIHYALRNDSTDELQFCTRGAEGTAAVAHADAAIVVHSTRTPVVSRFQLDTHLAVTDQRLEAVTKRIF